MNVYIDFINERPSKSGKTKIWDVVTKSQKRLGEIRWFAQWRQYTFYAEPTSIFNPDCLLTLANFCENATRRHRRNKKDLDL